MTAPLRIHIARLVLHGFDPRDRHAIAEAVHRQLAHLFAEGDAARHGDAPIAHARDVSAIAGVVARDTHLAVQPRIDRLKGGQR